MASVPGAPPLALLNQNGNNADEYDDEPPPYGEATIVAEAEEEPPPTYESLFADLKQVNNARSFVKFVNIASHFLDNDVKYKRFKVLLLVPILALIIIGALNVNKCPCEPYVPIFLIVSGLVIICKTLLFFCRNYTWLREDDNNKRKHASLNAIVNWLFGLHCFIGSIFVFKAVRLWTRTRGTSNYCSPLAFFLAITIIFLFYLLVSLRVLFFICTYATRLNESATNDETRAHERFGENRRRILHSVLQQRNP